MSFEPMQGIAVAQTPALVAPPLPPRRVSNNPPRLYSSLTDDELHIHLRRFNKQARHITAVSLPPGRLDFSPSASNGEAFSPDKLRSNLERLYLTVIKDVERALQEIKRLRSWSNPLRTFVWAAVSHARCRWHHILAHTRFLHLRFTSVHGALSGSDR